MIHTLPCGKIPLYFEKPGWLNHNDALPFRKRRKLSPEFLRRGYWQCARQKEHVVVQDGLLIDCPKLRQFEHGSTDRSDGDTQLKLVDRFLDIRTRTREHLHQHSSE